MKIVIPSRRRADKIRDCTLKLFPDAIVCVEESEVSDYAKVCDNILPHPPLKSLGAIRNWIIDNIDDEIIVQCDDDVIKCSSMVGFRERTLSQPNEIAQLIENAAEVAQGIGARLFGFNQSGDVKSFYPQHPFGLSTWLGTVFGIIGKDIKYDEFFSLHDDMDFSLQHLIKNRIVFRDNRFHFVSVNRMTSQGGNTAWRSQEQEQRERAMLKRKWGGYVKFGKRSVAATTFVSVKRNK